MIHEKTPMLDVSSVKVTCIDWPLTAQLTDLTLMPAGKHSGFWLVGGLMSAGKSKLMLSMALKIVLVVIENEKSAIAPLTWLAETTLKLVKLFRIVI
jgi:hypothetical protein